MLTAAVVQILGPVYDAGVADATVFHAVLGAILALRISLSSIVSTIGSGVVGGAA